MKFGQAKEKLIDSTEFSFFAREITLDLLKVNNFNVFTVNALVDYVKNNKNVVPKVVEWLDKLFHLAGC